MGRIFISFLKSIITILLIATFAIFGLIVYEEVIKENLNKLSNLEVATETGVEDFQTTIEEKETVDQDIETPQVVQGSWDNINLKEEEVKDIDYSEVQISTNKYFYNQLEEEVKVIYRALETNKENMKSGTYKVEFGNTFSNILKKENGSTILGNYYQSAIEAFIYDNAEVFYLSPNKMYLEIIQYSNNKYEVCIYNGKQSNYLVDRFSSSNQVNEAITQIENVKNSIMAKRTGNVEKDIKMVHDYLVETIEYDTSVSRQNIYDIYGALVNRVAVCEGYARAFKYIMDQMEIPCVLVMGKGTNSQGQTENHAWNYVQLQGRWYAIDATWDDPIIIGGGSPNKEMRYKYYLKGANTMAQNHTPSGQFTEDGKIFNYPELSSTDY